MGRMHPRKGVQKRIFGYRGARWSAVLGLGAVVALLSSLCMFSVDASEYALVTEFGAPVRVIKEPGLYFKYPYQSIRAFDNRLSVFAPPPSEHLTLEKTPVLASTAAFWRIADPQRFFETVFDGTGAESRLGDILYAELGAAIGRNPLQAFVAAEPGLYRVHVILETVRRAAAAVARRDYGIELTEVVLQGFEFPKQNRARLYARMKSERSQLSMRYRSEGEEEGLKIRTASEEEKSRILSDALGLAQQSRAEGEGEGARIAAQAFEASPEFYRFLRTLETARRLTQPNTTLVLPVDSDLFGLLLSSRWQEAAQAAIPGVASGP